MFEIGDKIYFKREGDKRLLKGTIIDVDGGSYLVRGSRTATKSTPPVFTIPSNQITADHITSSQRIKKTERHGSGLSIVASESIRRQAIVTKRLEMSEWQILQAKAMLEIRRRALRELAGKNRIPVTTDCYEYEELCSEYIIGTLSALRATAASATNADIKEFRRYLDGEAIDSRMMMTIKRTSRTAAIRYLKLRAQYYQLHVDIADHEYRLAA